MQWNTKVGEITTNKEFKIDFTLPELSATKIVTWNCHVNVSDTGKYDMILGRDLLTVLELNINVSDPGIESDD